MIRYKLLFCVFIWLVVVMYLKSTRASDSELSELDYGNCENWTSISANTQPSGNCTRHAHGRHLHCFGGITNLHHINHARKVEEITICGWPNKTFDPYSLLIHFPKIKVFRIEHSNLTHIYNDFPEMFELENINISWTNLAFTRPTLFKKLHNLKYLDLRWNKLDHMDHPLILSEIFQELHLAGNPWNCTRNFKWLLSAEKGIHVVDREILQCTDTKYQSKHLLTVMHYKMVLKTACQHHAELRNCSCTMHYIRKSDDGKFLIPIYAVNCSNLQLYRFPSYLPANTTIFYASHNQITDVQSLRNNIHYHSVIDVYLDFNQIQNIDVLEAGYWLRHFRVLSLRGNKLTKLPIYALDNALEKNSHAAKLYLSQNPWICDCKFTMRFREILMKYVAIIKDSHNVTCNYIEGDNNFMAPVMSLDRHDVCKLPTDYKIYPLDLLNCILAFLIIFVISKLGYDYYHYRRSGRLPWIVTKIP